jgi:NAD(P)H-hydrate repair Nnr-like enzyme with NAD(P)H-hydrate epimerase domain
MQSITSIQSAKIDQEIEKLGFGVDYMMEFAGLAIANLTAGQKPKSIAILCGKGNNGRWTLRCKAPC